MLGSLQAGNGTTTLTSLPQLSNGTLTGASFFTTGATVVLPADITHLVSANIGVGAKSAIKDAHGRNPLTGLTSVDPRSSLSLGTSLALTGASIAANGTVSVSGAALTLTGPFTQAQGALSLSSATLNATQVTIGQGAMLQAGQGTISGNLVNDGNAAVLGAAASQVTGSYSQAPNASLTSGFTGIPGSRAPLAVAGNATLAGVVLSSDFLPSRGDSAPAITFGSLSGGFTGHSPGFRLVTKAHEVDVVVHPQLTAAPATVAPGGPLP